MFVVKLLLQQLILPLSDKIDEILEEFISFFGHCDNRDHQIILYRAGEDLKCIYEVH